MKEVELHRRCVSRDNSPLIAILKGHAYPPLSQLPSIESELEFVILHSTEELQKGV